MKEYCLVPASIAEQFMFNRPKASSPPKVSLLKKEINRPKPPHPSPPPVVLLNLDLDDLIRVAVAPPDRDYGLSLIKLLDGKPNISWDKEGTFFPPFSGLSVVVVINTLGNPKAKFSNAPKPLVKLLFRLAQLSPKVIRNISQKTFMTSKTFMTCTLMNKSTQGEQDAIISHELLRGVATHLES